ncbi:hypothetical protein N7486_002159 [Penicillium sp. IBT 16267x]|nr:hypothetical protein N7486_002159 [Penicillium sp. IBT 16267x]
MSLPVRTLGRDGPQVSAIGLGLDHANATGLQFWDTADVYLDSEDVVGEWVKRSGNRDDIFLATKFGLLRQPDGSHEFRSDPEYVKAACEKSLQRLGVDTIDLYYCHRVDGVTPIQKTIEAMVELKNQGKIRYLGLSGVSASTLRRAHAVHPITALQMEYSLFTLVIESPSSGILNTCRELGVTIVAYCPIGRGILTGQFQFHADLPEGDLRRRLPKFSEKNFPAVQAIVQKLKDVAEVHGCTTAQVALAWLLAQGPDIIPIPGTKSPVKMGENADAGRIKLSDDELQDIRTLVERTAIEGSQYSAATMAALQDETTPL